MDKNNKIKIILLLILRGACKQGLFRSLSKVSCYECRGLLVPLEITGACGDRGCFDPSRRGKVEILEKCYLLTSKRTSLKAPMG